MFNVAFGAPGHWSRIIQNDSVPFLDVTSEDYWLVDTSVVPETPGGNSGAGTGAETGNGAGNTGTGTGGNSGTGEGGNQPTPETKTYKKVTISGQVPLENYAQLFTSFVQTLRNNNLKVEIKFSASTTVANPLTDNSPTVKSIKESASQLGLLFDPEE